MELSRILLGLIRVHNKSVPTKRALDAGDSALAPSIFHALAFSHRMALPRPPQRR
jgi:hypothetical protein